jgi:hypothetical protein
MYSQTFIRTIDGKNYWSEKSLNALIGEDEIPVNNGRNIIRIQKSIILLMEDMEAGLKIIQPDKINKVEPLAFDGDLEAFLAKGKRIYIPLASSITQQRWGARKLRELFDESDYWQLVGCEDEADFILEYIFDDEGKDKAYILVSDRMGKNVLYTSHIFASDWVPAHAGIESAEKLFKIFFSKCVHEGKIMKKASYIKKPSDKTYNCSYYVRVKL